MAGAAAYEPFWAPRGKNPHFKLMCKYVTCLHPPPDRREQSLEAAQSLSCMAMI